jgi:hypothetical protein
MRRFIVFTAIVCLMACFPAAMVGQTTHLKFTQDAEFASLAQNINATSNFTLTVSRNAASGTTTSASINYLEFDFAADFSSFTFVQIVGAIPTSAFTGQTTNDLVLNFNTSQLDPTTSISQSCTFSFVTFIETCGAAPTGLLSVEWKGNNVVSSEVAIIREDTMGGFTTKLHQHSDNSTASATGSVFGVAVNPSSAQVGVNHSSTLELIKN